VELLRPYTTVGETILMFTVEEELRTI
jgi:hypothetical protein